jgi:hypothetical protein
MATENPHQAGHAGNSSDEIAQARTQSLLRNSMNAAAFSHRLALLDIEAQHRLAWHQSHFNPNQPRVPAGHPDGGQWTNSGGGIGIRVAAADKSGRGLGGAIAAALLHLAMTVIEAYRSEKGLLDLLKDKIGVVAWTRFKGQDIFGSNSTSPTYTSADRKAAERMRATLIEKYPNITQQDNIGQVPNNAFFHAEATVLLRAAKENGDTLAGQTLEVFVDRPMCEPCKTMLPYIGLELGNPTVTFIDLAGQRMTMQGGAWAK